MARGDIFVNMVSVANAAGANRQPSSGVEELLTAAGVNATEGTAPNGVPPVDMSIYDGTNQATTFNGDAGIGAANFLQMKQFYNNTNYLRFGNQSGSTLYVFMGGVVVG